MTGKVSLWRNAHWVLLIMAALMVRAMVPQGYMAAQDDAGGLSVTVCNSDVVMVIPMKDDGSSQHDQDGDNTTAACAFAASTDTASAPDNGAALSLPQLAEAAYDAVRQRALSPTTPGILPPARAPPAIV